MQVQILTKEQHQEMQTLKDKYDQSHGSPFDVGACGTDVVNGKANASRVL